MLRIWKEKLLQGLKDDGAPWDWTGLGAFGKREPRIRARIVAKSPGVWAAHGLAAAAESLAQDEWGAIVKIRSRVQDGAILRAGTVVAEWSGPASALLALERPYLNLASFVSGIATRTHGLVKQVQKHRVSPSPRVTLTRKTLPGYRDLSIHGVICGGGSPHRATLAGGVLIKENHIAASKGIKNAIQGVRSVAPHGLKMEVEVRNSKELEQALMTGVDGVLLDNFSPKEVRLAIKRINELVVRPFVEVSGGIHEDNIGAYVLPGVDVISVGSLTHSVTALDLTFLVESR